MALGQKTRQLSNIASAQGQCSQRSVGTSSATSVRNVQGINKGKGLDRLLKIIGCKPIKLNILAERRSVGENNKFLSREIEIITRYHAPIQCLGWQNMTEVDKEALHTLLKKRSAIGKDNHSNLPYMHRKGTKSFVALQDELGCGDITLYK